MRYDHAQREIGEMGKKGRVQHVLEAFHVFQI